MCTVIVAMLLPGRIRRHRWYTPDKSGVWQSGLDWGMLALSGTLLGTWHGGLWQSWSRGSGYLLIKKCIIVFASSGMHFTKELKTYDQMLKFFIIFKLPTVWVKHTCIYYQNISDLMILYKLYLLKFITCECKDLWFKIVFLAFFGQW